MHPGNRRIAFIGGDPDVSTGRERMEGYQRALVRCGLPLDPRLSDPAPPTRRGGYESVQRLIQIENRSDSSTLFQRCRRVGAIDALQHAGLRAGKELGVVGFNNVPDAAQSLPGLTTVDTSPRELGETAAELLLKRIEQPDSPIRTMILQLRQIVRQSCGAES